MSSSSSFSSLSLHTIEDLDEDPFDYVDPSLQSRLFAASRNNDVAAVQAEIAKGKEINNIENRGYTALHIAAKSESFDVLKLLLKQPTLRKNEQCFRGCTPLELACFFNKEIECILELITAGCNINLPNDEYLLTLLIGNANMEWEKKKTVIEILIKNGVDYDRPKILEEFIKCYNRTEECLEILHLFLYYNIDVNANGVEPLTFALKQGHVDICDILWDYIADFTINSDGLLIESLKHGYKFNEFIEKGVDITAANFFERPEALHAILHSSDLNTVDVFNSLWMRFEARDNVAALIENAYLALSYDFCDYSTYSPNKACVITFFNLYFKLLFETESDGFGLFCFCPLYRLFKLVELDKDEMLKMFYSYLMCNSRISYEQLKLLYQNCSKDEFETFLKVNVNIDVDKYDMDFIFNKDIRDGVFNYTKFDCILYPDLLPLDMDNEELPSLLKLSRNVIRKELQPDYKTMINEDLVYFRYYNKVNNWDVPQCIKDILLNV